MIIDAPVDEDRYFLVTAGSDEFVNFVRSRWSTAKDAEMLAVTADLVFSPSSAQHFCQTRLRKNRKDV